jgi:hypothetical protein
MLSLFKEFRWSLFFTVVAMLLAWQWAGWEGLFVVSILMVLEISLSFDNAVVNATILEKMDPIWQQRFLTWGMLIAVFGMRVLFPLVIVALIASMSIWDVGYMALNDPQTYATHLASSHIQVAAFGGMFLLMVFLGFIFDKEKDIHWLGHLEQYLSKLGNLESIEIIAALVLLLTTVHFLPESSQAGALVAGVIGLVTFVLLSAINKWMESTMDVTGTVARTGFASFMYLEVLDASFSFDGVIGAFAITQDVVIIMLGLGIGALFVRSITISLVKHGILNAYVYLSHGAHYAIGALATIMFLSMHMHVPEVITGLIGAAFISAGMWSSIRHNRDLTSQA